MTTTSPSPPAPASRVRKFLADGLTVADVATRAGWPRQRVVSLISSWPGWLHDHQRDIAYRPAGAPRDTTPRPTPAAPARPAKKAAEPMQVTLIPIINIEPHPGNVRHEIGDVTELADSIKARGLLQPLVVQPHPGNVGRFQIIAGHRRYAAAQLAGLTEIPAVVRSAVTDDTAIELMLIENCHRANLNPVEKAEAFGALRDRGYSQTSISQRTGFAVSTISYFLALLDLDKASLERVRGGELAVTHAVSAVRQTRAKQRKRQGSTADYSWEPDYLSKTHPLARKAGRTCDAREHTMRRRIGNIACGQCWETVIRDDERTVVAAAGTES